MRNIYYKSGYKYQLSETYSTSTNIHPVDDVLTDYIDLFADGHIVIRKGYAWDGPSGPTIDTKNFMRGSLVHDAIYGLMRQGLLKKDNRGAADLLLRRMCKEDGMSSIRAWWVYRGVRLGGGSAVSNRKKVLTAP